MVIKFANFEVQNYENKIQELNLSRIRYSNFRSRDTK